MWFVFFCVAAGVLLFCRSSDSALDSADHLWWWMKFEHGAFGIPDPRSLQPLHSNDMMAALDDSSSFYNRCKHLLSLPDAKGLWQPGEFHFSWVYTFFATLRSLRIWSPVPPIETGCDPALPAQLCWSSGSSFPHRLSDTMQICFAVHLNRPVKRQRLDNLPFFFGALAFLQLQWFLSRLWNS